MYASWGPCVIAPLSAVGSYRVIEALGEGGEGTVFLVEHVALGRRLALKALHPEHASNPEAVERFLREARAISSIGHEHIVAVTDFGKTSEGQSYFVMELLEGESLAARLQRQGPFTLADTVRILAQVADALGAAHAAGIVHRDLKPENIFLIEKAGSRDFVKLLDFGVAKLTRADGPPERKTRSGLLLGTPYYMSPEQCLGKRGVDHRTDVYALGVICYELLVGAVPFDAENWGELLLMHTTMPFPSLRERCPGLDPGVERVIGRAVAKDPEERWSSMLEVQTALLGLLTSDPAAATLVTPSAPAAMPPSTGAQPAITPSEAAPLDLAAPTIIDVAARGPGSVRRPGAAVMAATVLLIAAAGAAALGWLRSGGTPPAPPGPATPPMAAAVRAADRPEVTRPVVSTEVVRAPVVNAPLVSLPLAGTGPGTPAAASADAGVPGADAAPLDPAPAPARTLVSARPAIPTETRVAGRRKRPLTPVGRAMSSQVAPARPPVPRVAPDRRPHKDDIVEVD
jgi:tRNA A-37 threonylcarbamoyl transferase component Bud32